MRTLIALGKRVVFRHRSLVSGGDVYPQETLLQDACFSPLPCSFQNSVVLL